MNYLEIFFALCIIGLLLAIVIMLVYAKNWVTNLSTTLIPPFLRGVAAYPAATLPEKYPALANTNLLTAAENTEAVRKAPFVVLIDPEKRNQLANYLLLANTFGMGVPKLGVTREQILAMPGVLGIYPNTTMHALVGETKGKLGVEDLGVSSNRGHRTLVYVLDTGVNGACVPLAGAYDMTGDGLNDVADHGTWVAAAIKEIVPQADIISIKVLGNDGSGATSVIAAGLELAYRDAQKQYESGAYDRIFTNMSLGGMPNAAMDYAANEAAAERIMSFVASGNNALGRVGSPAGAEKVVTVGALDGLDKRANFSQYQASIGKPDVSAPGVDLLAMNNRCDPKSRKSGTSMATPLALGLTAYASNDIVFSNMTQAEFDAYKWKVITSGNSRWNEDGTGYSKLNVPDLERALKNL